MPRCRYEVIDPETKETVEVVTVGTKLLHRWICESTAPDFWCMTVHSCHVEDDTGTTFSILDEKGCSIDRYLLDNLEYGPEQLQAQKEAHAFKFADKVVVNFQCSIRIDIRDGECPIPACEDPLKSERRIRPRSAGHIHEISDWMPTKIMLRQCFVACEDVIASPSIFLLSQWQLLFL
ncbi:hypothetical protein DICVIV_12055 [Dictyocaulus viviparus]|uniref:ZP domain-containing protein n=1 Tax=Dictyocaulus viviparus TaxID=29172 RepID=A0A0D8XI12_DICVI|nr:hypothetical protein DICVIV_12055 [Dictyocaulus viviparus]